MEEWIGLIDCNNFFASCERLFRPDLRHKPVVVLSSNDGCVVARSQEIKDKGIPMGVPYFKVKDILKDIEATTFSSHFALYRDISRRVFNVVNRECEAMEQYSIDEAFFILRGSKGEVESQLFVVKDIVEREVGMPVSVGVGKSKTLAKYANQIAKKTNGVFVLTMNEWQDRAALVPLRDLWGVGYRLTEEYKKHALNTVADLLPIERRQIQALFGVVGVRMWLELKGISTTSSGSKEHIQGSILHSRSFKHTAADILVLQDAVAYHVREASEDLRDQGLKTRCLKVSLQTSRHDDWFLQGGSKEVIFNAPTNDIFVLLKAATRLVDELYREGVPYKKAGILLYDLVPEQIHQGSLFEDPQEAKTASLTPLIDSLNIRLNGKAAVLVGSYLRGADWESSRAKRSPAYTTSWSDLVTARA